MSATETVYLVISADRRVRVVKRTYSIGANEVAVAVRLKFPATWGRVASTIDVDLPDFAPTVESVAVEGLHELRGAA
jgi:hypothetical protein